MATSLVSTGVQFPDSTIQTTAASSPPGATAQYSVVGKSVNGYGVVATTMSNLAAGNVSVNNFLGVYSSGAGQYRTLGAPFWSSYYSRWFSLMSSNGSVIGVYSSTDGLDWFQVSENLATAIGISASYVSQSSSVSAATFAVDDSNGRFFYLYTDGTNVKIAYSSLTSSEYFDGYWTTATIRTGTAVGALTYCKMATTGASGLVAQCSDSGPINSYIYTCSAGSTTFTLRLTLGTGGTNVGGPVIFEQNGKIFSPFSGELKIAYNTSGDITTGWSQVNPTTQPSNQSIRGCVGNGYMVYINANSIYYSTNGTTWTAATPGSSNLAGIIYTGSVFIAWSNTNSTYVSATNTPITWSLYNGSTSTLKSLCSMTKPWSQRVVA